MDEEKRTLTTEYSNIVIDLNAPDDDPLIIPKQAVDIMAEFFLEQMREEYERNNTIKQ